MLDFKRFIKNLLLFSSPLLLLALSYFIFDPFHILYNYSVYPDNYAKSMNRDRISTQTFLNNNAKQHYESFIFGSSRSTVFFTQDWAKYITSESKTTIFHFDASNETISGIANKLKFIDKQKNTIKNALIILDIGSFSYPVDTLGSVYIQDWRVSGLSPVKYHQIFFQTYFSSAFFLRYLDYKFFHTFRPYMNQYLENRQIKFVPVSNDHLFSSYEDSLRKDSVHYYARPLFFERPKEEVISKEIIKPYQVEYLKEIKAILDKNKTNYQVVIDPMYNQTKFNPADFELLTTIFGKDKVHNFTGINNYTNNKHNYYEIYHYRPHVARSILKQIYINYQ